MERHTVWLPLIPWAVGFAQAPTGEISGAIYDASGAIPNAQVSLISISSGRAPFQRVITGAGFYGTGVDQFLLPGSVANRFNFGLGKGRLAQLADQYHSTYAGKAGPNPSHAGNLLAPALGQPGVRFSIFGSGGHRSFQLGTRLSF